MRVCQEEGEEPADDGQADIRTRYFLVRVDFKRRMGRLPAWRKLASELLTLANSKDDFSDDARAHRIAIHPVAESFIVTSRPIGQSPSDRSGNETNGSKMRNLFYSHFGEKLFF